MAITYNSIPESYALSRNPLVFDVTTDNYQTTAGVKAKKKFSFSSNPSDGDQLRIGASGVMGISYWTFYCDDTPDGPTEFQSIGVESQEDYLEFRVIPAIKSSQYIHPYFEVYRDGTSIVIEAKEYGPDYTIDELTAVGFTISETVDTDGVALVNESDFKLRYRVNLEREHDGGQYDQSPWFLIIPDEDGNALIDVSQIATELYNELDLHGYTLASMTRELLSIRGIYLEVAEHFGASPWENDSYLSTVTSVMKGGLASRDLDNSFKTSFVDGKKFITNLPAETWVSRSTKVFLHFIFNHVRFASEDVLIKATVYWKDGTDDTTTLVTDSDMEIGELWALPGGFDQNNLQALDVTKEAFKWKIWAVGATLGQTALNEVSFMIVEDHHLDHALQYINSYGLLETIHCRAESRRTLNAEREHLQVKLPDGSGPEDSRLVPYAINMGEQIQFATGPISQLQAEALADVLLSETFYWIPPEYAGSKRYAVSIIPESYQLGHRNHKGIYTGGMRFTVQLNQEIGNSNINKIWYR